MGRDGRRPAIPDSDVVAIAEQLGINHEAEWLADQAGKVSEQYWDTHPKGKLFELAAELGVHVRVDAKKLELVEEFLAKIPGPEDKEAGLPYPRNSKRSRRLGERKERSMAKRTELPPDTFQLQLWKESETSQPILTITADGQIFVRVWIRPRRGTMSNVRPRGEVVDVIEAIPDLICLVRIRPAGPKNGDEECQQPST
jgi:hypothetical protein